jgi:cob(I)alamin adenosyltransferase
MPYGEHAALARFSDLVTIEEFGRDCFIRNQPTNEDREAARAGWDRLLSVVMAGGYDIVILDEIGIAIHYHLVGADEVITLIDRKPYHVELVLTGRKIPEALFEKADLVTEMREIRHYYNRGVAAREGIEY